MDISMPIMNGIEATIKLKKINADIPIVAVTAYVTEFVKKRICDAGFTELGEKTIPYNTLIKVVSKYLKA